MRSRKSCHVNFDFLDYFCYLTVPLPYYYYNLASSSAFPLSNSPPRIIFGIRVFNIKHILIVQEWCGSSVYIPIFLNISYAVFGKNTRKGG